MSWPAALIAAYLLLGLELGLSPALGIRFGTMPLMVPGFVMPLVVFVAMHAALHHALWFALIIGATLDLLGPIGSGADALSTVVHLGPNALGYMAGAFAVYQVRNTVIRRNPRSVVALTIIAGVVAAIISVSLTAFRSLYEGGGGGMFAELVSRCGTAVYTGLPALLLAFPMIRWVRIFGFPDANQRRFSRRMQ
ncbi:MAG: hypothetical protein KF745_01740 [Phycisphaeraceae bacterium]|nr:hypothetical protein [Phycisphaeraceae bacterium]